MLSLETDDDPHCGEAVACEDERPVGARNRVRDTAVASDQPVTFPPGRGRWFGERDRASGNRESPDLFVEMPWAHEQIPATSCSTRSVRDARGHTVNQLIQHRRWPGFLAKFAPSSWVEEARPNGSDARTRGTLTRRRAEGRQSAQQPKSHPHDR